MGPSPAGNLALLAPNLAPGKPIRAADVRCPERAHRGRAVTVLFPVRPARPGGWPSDERRVLCGGDDQHAVVGFVFQVKEPQQGHSQLRTVGSGTAQEVRGAAVVITAMPGP